MFGHQILSSLSFPKLISSLFLTSHPIIPPLHMELIWSWCVHFLGCIFCEMNQSNTSFSLCTQNWFFSLSHISSYHPIIINLHMGLLWIWHVRFLYWTYCPISTTGAFGWPFTSHFSFKCVIWGVIQPPPPTHTHRFKYSRRRGDGVRWLAFYCSFHSKRQYANHRPSVM